MELKRLPRILTEENYIILFTYNIYTVFRFYFIVESLKKNSYNLRLRYPTRRRGRRVMLQARLVKKTIPGLKLNKKKLLSTVGPVRSELHYSGTGTHPNVIDDAHLTKIDETLVIWVIKYGRVVFRITYIVVDRFVCLSQKTIYPCTQPTRVY